MKPEKSRSKVGLMSGTGRELKLERIKAGVAAGDVARLAGMNAAILSRIERGFREPSESEVISIRKAIKKLAAIERQRQSLLAEAHRD